MLRTTQNTLTVLASTLIGATILVSNGDPARGQATSSRPASSASATGVRDRARMFQPGAVALAEKQLREAETEGPDHWQILIETLDTLGGTSPSDAAAAIVRDAKLKGVLVLMGKKEHHVWVFPTKEAEHVFSESEKTAIADLVTQSFKKGEFDKGLLTAAAELRRAGIGYGVRDRGKMFTSESLARADATLERIHKETGWDIVVETVESLKGEKASDVANANARGLNVHGLYLLISKGDRTIRLEPSNPAKSSFTPEKLRQAEAALTSAFRAGDNDKGLLGAIESLRAAAQAAPDRSAKPDVVARAPDVPVASAPMHLPGPGDPPSRPSTGSTPTLPIPPLGQKPTTLPGPPRGDADAAPSRGPGLMFYLLLAGGALFLYWKIKQIFRRAMQKIPNLGGPSSAQPYQPQPQPQAPPGYAPQRPGSGYGHQTPGYGYDLPQPNLGYGPAPQPQQGGGGFASGMLGGIGGAILGNVIYDHLGRPVPQENHPQGFPLPHNAAQMPIPGAGHSPSQDGSWPPPAIDPNTGQPSETFDPNAGVGATWGEPESASSAEPVGGDWGAPEPASAPDPGDWSGGNDDTSGSGEWGGPDPANDPTPQDGGDWGGDPAGEGDAGTGGNW
jgi:uncharacterized membrane protein YgcG